MPRSPGCQRRPDRAIAHSTEMPISPRTRKETGIMRRRPIIRKAVKTAIIAKAAQRLGRRAETHLSKH